MSAKQFLILLVTPMLSSCFLGEVQLHGKEFEDAMKAIKPYGAHWVKEGMTRESRRLDLASCGSPDHEQVSNFPVNKIQAARLQSDANEVNARLRLRNQVGLCMQTKGYSPIGDLQFLGGCDLRCMYP